MCVKYFSAALRKCQNLRYQCTKIIEKNGYVENLQKIQTIEVNPWHAIVNYNCLSG